MKVFQYIRISTKDQSNASIEGQLRLNEMFAEKNGMDIIDTFIDDGASGKDFDRPEWKKLEKRLRKREVQGVIVWKYDRLIRNVMEGLAFLDRAENKYNVTIYSAMETFSIDPYSPFFFKMRANLLVDSDFERRVILDRTSMGIWSSRMEGRYTARAPFGYINERDDRNKPIIVIDEKKRHIIEFIFDAYAKGLGAKRIHSTATKMGFTHKGNSAIPKIISNPLYKGYVKVPSYKGDPEKLVKGIHQQIISTELWDRCQRMSERRPARSGINEHLPLRGYAQCECGNIMSGSKSKGRSKFYHYYRCMECSGVNINTDNVNAMMISILNQMSLKPMVLQAVENNLLKKIGRLYDQNNSEIKIIDSKIKEIAAKKQALDKKFIFEDSISEATYKAYNDKFEKELFIYENDKEYLLKTVNITEGKVKSNIKKLGALGDIYDRAKAIDKQNLVKYIFFEFLILSNRKVRTGKISDIFYANGKNIKELDIIKKREHKLKYAHIPLSSP